MLSFLCRAIEIKLQAHNLAQAVSINVDWVITALGNIRYQMPRA